MTTRSPIAIGEWYHCYNRGVDKRRVFETKADYERFLYLLYISNGTVRVQTSHLKSNRLREVVRDESLDRGDPLVEIGAYALMPNHAHLVIKEIREGGIATFMQKVFTGYTMYFNKKNDRTGALFAGSYKSKHVHNDLYIKKLINYVHLNPIELIEPLWKEGKGKLRNIEPWLLAYQYSSLPDFYSDERDEKKLIGKEVFGLFDSIPGVREMLRESKDYHLETAEVKPRRG